MAAKAKKREIYEFIGTSDPPHYMINVLFEYLLCLDCDFYRSDFTNGFSTVFVRIELEPL